MQEIRKKKIRRKRIRRKKRRRVVFFFLIMSIGIILFINVQAKDKPLNDSIYHFLEDEGNQKDVYTAAIELNKGSSANTCVYFISEVLRRNNINVPNETNNISKILPLLEANGLEKEWDYEKLTPGDICFTTDEKGDENGIPTHTYVFMKWVEKGSYDYAYICDNQAKDYDGKVYHIRNINFIDKANGSDKDAFAFFIK